jgi:hypothetical protein
VNERYSERVAYINIEGVKNIGVRSSVAIPTTSYTYDLSGCPCMCVYICVCVCVRVCVYVCMCLHAYFSSVSACVRVVVYASLHS